MIIAVDAAGGEYAPHEIVKGAVKAAQEYKVGIALVGTTKSLVHVLTARHAKGLNLSFVEANQVIGLHESPVKAIQSKPNSSIVVGTNLVKDGIASAFVSAGNSGAIVAAALFRLGKIERIERPAIGTIINVDGHPFLLIDAGANADCRPEHLVRFAQLGSIYSRNVFNIKSPRVGLLSNGEEETKGNNLIKGTHKLLVNTELNFIGNIEGHDLAGRKADVVVTDGFTGNIVLKTMEGVGGVFQNLQKHLGTGATSSPRLQGNLLLHLVGLDAWAKRMDYREYGGACLLGVNGNIIIAHGRSQAKAIKNAVGLTKRIVEQELTVKIKEDIGV